MLAKSARLYLADTEPPGIELDALFKLKSEVTILLLILKMKTLLLVHVFSNPSFSMNRY